VTSGNVCGRAIVVDPGKRGRPPVYCDDPDHTAVRALRARQRLALADAPITTATQTLTTLAGHFQALIAEHTALLGEAQTAFATAAAAGAA
jgi:hypothetical protein